MTAPSLPGTLRDLLTVGMAVTEHTDWLHTEYDPDRMRPRGGIIHTVGNGTVGVVAVGLRGHIDGLALDEIPTDRIHDCDDDYCPHRPRLARPADVRYHARWLLRIVGEGTGRLTDRDRRLTAVAVSLLTKGLP